MEVAVSQRMNVNLVLHNVDCPSQSQTMGLTEVLLLADPFSAQEPQHCVVVGGGDHVQEQCQESDPSTGECSYVQVISDVEFAGFANRCQGHSTSLAWHCIPRKQTILPGVHADPAMLINAGCCFSQNVDVVAGLLHVEQEQDGDGSEGKHCQPDEGQDVRHYDKRQAEAAATLGTPEFAKSLLDCTRGVETLSQQQDAIEEEKGCQAIDHVLEVFDKRGHDHIVLNVAGKVSLDEDFGIGQRFVPTATK